MKNSKGSSLVLFFVLGLLLCFAAPPAHAQIGNVTRLFFPGVPTGPCNQTQEAVNTSNGNFYVCGPAGSWLQIGAGGAPAAINSQTASYALVLADAFAYVRMNVASANTVTVPLNASVAFPIGTNITVRQAGAGQTTIVATGGVTINTPSSLALRVQNSSVQLLKVATDTWDLMGDTQ